jgi:hypothetical protein
VTTSYDIRNGRFVNFNCAPNLSPSNSAGTTWRVRWYVWVYNPANSTAEQDKVLADLESYSWDNFTLMGRFRNAYHLKCEVIATSSGGTTSSLSNGVRIFIGK